jgi:crotonobetainyl-CoA:carnitine CoA-transferase CaiB-like acyl-CoA transferase
MDDPWARNHGLVHKIDFPHAGPGTIVGPAPRLSRTPMKLGAPVGPRGLDSRAVLNDIGLGDQADELIAAGVVKEFVPPAATAAL